MTPTQQVAQLTKERDDYEHVLQSITKGYNSSDDHMWWVKECRRVLRRYGKLRWPRQAFKQQILDPMRKKGLIKW